MVSTEPAPLDTATKFAGGIRCRIFHDGLPGGRCIGGSIEGFCSSGSKRSASNCWVPIACMFLQRFDLSPFVIKIENMADVKEILTLMGQLSAEDEALVKKAYEFTQKV